jgi:hypothetical protein
MTPSEDINAFNANLLNYREIFENSSLPSIVVGEDFVADIKSNFDELETLCSIIMPVSIIYGLTGKQCREGINSNFVAIEQSSSFVSVVPITFTTTANPQTTTYRLKVNVGKVVTINWGDGNTDIITGDGVLNTYAHTYTSTVGVKYIRIKGNLNDVKSFAFNENSNMIMNVDYLARFTTLSYLQLISGYVQRGLIENLPLSLEECQVRFIPGSINHLPSGIKIFRMLHGLASNTGSSDNFPSTLETVDWTGDGNNVEFNIGNLSAGIINLCLDGSENGLNVHGSFLLYGQKNPNAYYLEVGSSLGDMYGDFADLPIGMRDFALSNQPHPDLVTGDIKDIFTGVPTLYTSLMLTNCGVNAHGNVEDMPLTLVRLVIVNTPGVIYNGGNIPAWVIPSGYYIVINNSWSTAMVDAFLIACAASLPSGASNIPITLTGTNQARSAASNAAVATLTGKGYIVTAN